MAHTEKIRPDLSTLRVILDLCQRMIDRRTGVRQPVAIGIGLEGASSLLAIVGPFALKTLIDELTAGEEGTQTIGLAIAFVLSWVGTSFLSTLRMVYSTRVLNRLTQILTSNAIQSSLPEIAAARNCDSGAMLGALERLPFSLMVVVDGLIWQLAPIGLQIVGSLGLICLVLPIRYVLILAVILFAYAMASLIGASAHRQRSTEANLATSEVSRLTGDILRNARRVVFNGALDLELKRIAVRFGSKAQANNALMWSLVRLVAWQYGVIGIGLITLLALGAVDTLAQKMTVGTFVLLQAYAFRLAMPLSSVGFILSQTAVAIANIRDVLTLGKPPAEVGGPAMPMNAPAPIVLEDVGFSYDGVTRTLDTISVKIEPGSFVVIVGPNGSGKSTLAQIIAGVRAPNCGQVLVGGINLNAVRRSDRHRLVLYVPQYAGMFNRTLRANGLYAPTTHTETDLAQILTQWRFYDDGRRVNLDLAVGEQGERLSGGQLQKLELARISGVSVATLILDESTSALDPASEAEVMDDLQARLTPGTTLILITHHIQMAMRADRVLYMAEGRIKGDGPHDSLLRSLPEYSALWGKA